MRKPIGVILKKFEAFAITILDVIKFAACAVQYHKSVHVNASSSHGNDTASYSQLSNSTLQNMTAMAATALKSPSDEFFQ